MANIPPSLVRFLTGAGGTIDVAGYVRACNAWSLEAPARLLAKRRRDAEEAAALAALPRPFKPRKTYPRQDPEATSWHRRYVLGKAAPETGRPLQRQSAVSMRVK
jgi:hypothetical protein